MQIACPYCMSLYDVPASQLHSDRHVRCFRCSTTWSPLPASPVRRRVPWLQGSAYVAAALLVGVSAFELATPVRSLLSPAEPGAGAPVSRVVSTRLSVRPTAPAPNPEPAKVDTAPAIPPADTAPSSAPAERTEPSSEAANPDPPGESFASAPVDTAPPVQPFALREGGPGLMLVAGPGDTMRALYAKVYQGLHPPDYAEVLAANREPVRPGTVLLFPTPPDGWSKP